MLVISSHLKIGYRGIQRTLTTLLTALAKEAERPVCWGPHTHRPALLEDDNFDANARQKRQFMQLVNLTQRFLREAATRRQQFFWEKTDTSSLTQWEETCKNAKNLFLGRSDREMSHPRMCLPTRGTRLIYDEPRWKRLRSLSLMSGMAFSAYGILLLPNDLEPGETAARCRLSTRFRGKTAGYRRSENRICLSLLRRTVGR